MVVYCDAGRLVVCHAMLEALRFHLVLVFGVLLRSMEFASMPAHRCKKQECIPRIESASKQPQNFVEHANCSFFGIHNLMRCTHKQQKRSHHILAGLLLRNKGDVVLHRGTALCLIPTAHFRKGGLLSRLFIYIYA